MVREAAGRLPADPVNQDANWSVESASILGDARRALEGIRSYGLPDNPKEVAAAITLAARACTG
jgi:hypothetical protein